ncbi:MAG TPA: hypothetical protein VHD60_01270 [Candidatus Saccharimonadales bacterium]|nr:hypothetical protein [Candidatus Saccharimonadales bacterium]
MRIPITIKVPVRVADPTDSPSLANVIIRDVSEGLEKISVRLLHRPMPSNKLTRKKPVVGGEIRRSSPTRFPVVFQPPTNSQPAPIVITPRLRYTVKTIHITLTWPTLPAATEVWRKLTRLRRKVWLRVGIVALTAVIAIVCIHIFGSNGGTQPASHPAAAKAAPKLTRGTPDYTTVLPSGKTINQLGGWTRISPPGKDPVYTYVDKIGKVQLNVSEQPLPDTFKANTASKISQLAASYNATDKVTASNNTIVYIASSDSGSQSVIFTKAGLLILIRSSDQVSNNQWVDYVSALR